MARKVIITCAVTGSIHTPSMSPHLPVTPDQIATQAVEAAEAGAAKTRASSSASRPARLIGPAAPNATVHAAPQLVWQIGDLALYSVFLMAGFLHREGKFDHLGPAGHRPDAAFPKMSEMQEVMADHLHWLLRRTAPVQVIGPRHRPQLRLPDLPCDEVRLHGQRTPDRKIKALFDQVLGLVRQVQLDADRRMQRQEFRHPGHEKALVLR